MFLDNITKICIILYGKAPCNNEVMTAMKLQFDSGDKRMPWPFIWGLVTVLGWSVVLNTSSITHSFGMAPGIEVGPWVILGPLSRHWDPYILGALVAFWIWSFNVSPPTKFLGSDLSGMNAVCMIVGSMVVILVDDYADSVHGVYKVLIILGLCILLPFGWKSSVVLTLAMSVLLWYALGLAVVAFYVPLVWLGKWASWWTVNIIRYRGFDGAYKRLKELRLGLDVTASPSPSCSASAS